MLINDQRSTWGLPSVIFSLIQLWPHSVPKGKALQNRHNGIPPLPEQNRLSSGLEIMASNQEVARTPLFDLAIWALGLGLTLRQRWSTVLSWKILCHECTTSGRKDFTMKTWPGLRTSSSDQVLTTLMALRSPPPISSRDSTWIMAALPRWDQEDILFPRFKGELSSSL